MGRKYRNSRKKKDSIAHIPELHLENNCMGEIVDQYHIPCKCNRCRNNRGECEEGDVFTYRCKKCNFYFKKIMNNKDNTTSATLMWKPSLFS